MDITCCSYVVAEISDSTIAQQKSWSSAPKMTAILTSDQGFVMNSVTLGESLHYKSRTLESLPTKFFLGEIKFINM